MTRIRSATFSAFLAAALMAAVVAPASRALANADADAAMARVKDDSGVDVKKIFGTQCGLCHGDYGMTLGGRGGGPRLAGTKLDHEGVKKRIHDGKTGMMPSFKKMLKPEEIEALATYIKSLPTN